MKKTILSFASLLLIAMALVSCSNNSPKASAQKFLDGFYHMDLAAAKSVATDDTKKMIDGYEQTMAMFMQSAKAEMKKLKIEIKEPKVTGNTATVDYTVTGDPSVKQLRMVKQGDIWKADFSLADAFGSSLDGGGSAMGGGMNDTTSAPSADPNPADTTHNTMAQ